MAVLWFYSSPRYGHFRCAGRGKNGLSRPWLLSSGMDYLHSPADDLCTEDQCGTRLPPRLIGADPSLTDYWIPGWIRHVSYNRWLPRDHYEFRRMVPRPGRSPAVYQSQDFAASRPTKLISLAS